MNRVDSILESSLMNRLTRVGEDRHFSRDSLSPSRPLNRLLGFPMVILRRGSQNGAQLGSVKRHQWGDRRCLVYDAAWQVGAGGFSALLACGGPPGGECRRRFPRHQSGLVARILLSWRRRGTSPGRRRRSGGGKVSEENRMESTGKN